MTASKITRLEITGIMVIVIAGAIGGVVDDRSGLLGFMDICLALFILIQTWVPATRRYRDE